MRMRVWEIYKQFQVWKEFTVLSIKMVHNTASSLDDILMLLTCEVMKRAIQRAKLILYPQLDGKAGPVVPTP